jgi:predicted GH43/DUF377 family glycosyl hydrolase
MACDRNIENPIIEPRLYNTWEALATFNPSVIKKGDKFLLLYRAMSLPVKHHGILMSVSSIGYAESTDGVNFYNRRQLIQPEQEWEKFGCEDPRITFFQDKYYIFYTALSVYPFSAEGIHIGVFITSDFQNFEKHQVTKFNSKAMTLFSEKINGKFAAMLTINSDLPPASMALAFFDHEEEIWSHKYWVEWYCNLEHNIIPLLKNAADYMEVGAQPIKTDQGWLLIYSHIKNYFSEKKVFIIEAVLLDLNNPAVIIGKTSEPILVPEKKYELEGDVPNVVFPTGAIVDNNKLFIYYGAADTVCCVATIWNIQKMIIELITI